MGMDVSVGAMASEDEFWQCNAGLNLSFRFLLCWHEILIRVRRMLSRTGLLSVYTKKGDTKGYINLMDIYQIGKKGLNNAESCSNLTKSK